MIYKFKVPKFSHATVNFNKSISLECLKASILELNFSDSFELWLEVNWLLYDDASGTETSWLLSISGGKGSWRITTRHYQIQCQFKINAEINVGALVWNLTSFRLIIWYILTKDQMHLRDVRFPYNSFLFINRLECRKCYLDVIIQLNTPLKSFKFFRFSISNWYFELQYASWYRTRSFFIKNWLISMLIRWKYVENKKLLWTRKYDHGTSDFRVYQNENFWQLWLV